MKIFLNRKKRRRRGIKTKPISRAQNEARLKTMPKWDIQAMRAADEAQKKAKDESNE